MSLFCRHNRFTADCPICSKGTVLDEGARPSRSRPSSGGGTRRPAAERGGTTAFRGPDVAAPARTRPDGSHSVVRLERVPGGVRLGEWSGSRLEPRAPVVAASELADLVARSGEALQARDAKRLVEALATPADPARAADAGAGVSRGRSGDFKEELRVERLQDGDVRVARWVLRPNRGWELQDAAPMLPAARYAEAIADAVRRGVVGTATVDAL